jgi:DNA-binding FadR family transcriptional regulator
VSSTELLQAVEGLKEPRRLSHQVSALLAAEIVSGRIALGQAFPSSEDIVARFSVSRTVARETAQALAMLGLVRVQHGKRTEVCPPEEWDILSSVVQEAMRREGKAEPLLRDLYEFRLLIEPQAAAWMAVSGSEEDIAQLAELAATMERVTGGNVADVALPDLMEADRNFHDLVARAGDNRVLAAVSRDIREVIGTLWGLSTLGPDGARRVAEQHRAIADAVGRRDPAAALAAMRDHLTWAAQADLHGLGAPSELRFAAGTATG